MDKIQGIQKLFDYILEPKLKWNINTLGLLKKVALEKDRLIVRVNLITEDTKLQENFKTQVLEGLKKLHDGEIDLKISKAHVANSGIKGVKKVLFVASGKGGVGKSTISANLAGALLHAGHSVGLLDADIYGPSIPIMYGCEGVTPAVSEDETIEPITAHGVKTISIGSLIPKDKAVGWRGQMVSGTILQFIEKTAWEDLDFLVIDLPPGTGDVHLTLASKLKPDAVIIVATPQEVVLGDVQRSIDLFESEHFPIAGVVENMSYMLCEECGHANHPFARSQRSIEKYNILCELPLEFDISQAADEGKPLVLSKPQSSIAKTYQKLVTHLEDFVSFCK